MSLRFLPNLSRVLLPITIPERLLTDFRRWKLGLSSSSCLLSFWPGGYHLRRLVTSELKVKKAPPSTKTGFYLNKVLGFQWCFLKNALKATKFSVGVGKRGSYGPSFFRLPAIRTETRKRPYGNSDIARIAGTVLPQNQPSCRLQRTENGLKLAGIKVWGGKNLPHLFI